VRELACDEEALAELDGLLRGLGYVRERREEWLTLRQAAEYLAMGRGTLHKLTARRAIPFHQDAPGGRCKFRRSELDEWRMLRNGA
jgi:excisionase family DNA binding protein